MRAVFEIRNGLAAVQMDVCSFQPSFGEAAALAKTYGHRMAECSSLSDPEAFTLFKTIYASMVLEYAAAKGITMTPEMEEETEKTAMDYARDVNVKMLDHVPFYSGIPFQFPSGNLPGREEGESLFCDPEDLPFR